MYEDQPSMRASSVPDAQVAGEVRSGKVAPGMRAGSVMNHQRLNPGQVVARVILALLFGAGCFLSLVPLGRAVMRSALLLPALMSASSPAPLKLVGDPVRYSSMTLSTPNGPVYLDIYQPATSAPPIPGGREALINVIGVGYYRHDPQLINLSESFAREGIVVVDIGTPAMFQFDISAGDSQAVVQTFELMEHWPGVNPRHIGLFVICAGITPASIAAADPRIRDHVAFIAVLAAYFDVADLLRNLGTRSQVINGHVQPWHADSTPLYTLARTVSSLLTPTESQLIEGAFPLGKYNPPLTRQQQAQLSPSADAFYHLLEGDEPGSVDRNLAALSPQMKALLVQLSPRSVIGQIHAPIYLLHERNDTIVPYSQSLEFAAALERLHHPYTLAGYGIFSHVTVASGIGLAQWLSDGPKLFMAITRVVQPGS
jgi:pimeloyl-ACP methyl ester carboxylesterase